MRFPIFLIHYLGTVVIIIQAGFVLLQIALHKKNADPANYRSLKTKALINQVECMWLCVYHGNLWHIPWISFSATAAAVTSSPAAVTANVMPCLTSCHASRPAGRRRAATSRPAGRRRAATSRHFTSRSKWAAVRPKHAGTICLAFFRRCSAVFQHGCWWHSATVREN